jgi:flagellar hook assembly protein FlgD
MDVRVDHSGRCKIAVYNIVGQQVALLLDQDEPAGNQRVQWDGKNKFGETVGNGVYFVLVQTPDGRMTRQVIVLK